MSSWRLPSPGWTQQGWNTAYLGTGHPAGSSPLLIAGLAMAMLSFTLVMRPAHHAKRQPRDSPIHPGTRGADGRRQMVGAPLAVEEGMLDSGVDLQVVRDTGGRQPGLQHSGHGGQSASRMGNCSKVPGAK